MTWQDARRHSMTEYDPNRPDTTRQDTRRDAKTTAMTWHDPSRDEKRWRNITRRGMSTAMTWCDMTWHETTREEKRWQELISHEKGWHDITREDMPWRDYWNCYWNTLIDNSYCNYSSYRHSQVNEIRIMKKSSLESNSYLNLSYYATFYWNCPVGTPLLHQNCLEIPSENPL